VAEKEQFKYRRRSLMNAEMRMWRYLAGILCVSFFIGTGVAAEDSQIQLSQDNDTILSASSHFEDLIEAALAADRPAMEHALQGWEKESAAVYRILPIEVQRDLKAHIDTIKTAFTEEEYQTVAMNALEAYRLLIQSLDPEALVAPVAVSMLDYIGFRINVLLHASTLDWAAVQESAEEAQRHWSSVEGRVDEYGLRDVMHTMLAGMIKAATTQNTDMVAFAANLDLALVDVLEGYFERTVK
jgi:hypothetical protein